MIFMYNNEPKLSFKILFLKKTQSDHNYKAFNQTLKMTILNLLQKKLIKTIKTQINAFS